MVVTFPQFDFSRSQWSEFKEKILSIVAYVCNFDEEIALIGNETKLN